MIRQLLINIGLLAMAVLIHYEILYRLSRWLPRLRVKRRTTLGFGDIEPIGDLRYLTGIESLSGLVLIT